MTTNSAWTSFSATFVDAENVPKTFSGSLLPYAKSFLSHFLDTQAIFCCFSSLYRPLSTTLMLTPESITIFTSHPQSPPLFQAVTSILQWTHTHLPCHCLPPTCISPSPSLLASYRFWFGCLGSALRSKLISTTTCLAGFSFRRAFRISTKMSCLATSITCMFCSLQTSSSLYSDACFHVSPESDSH